MELAAALHHSWGGGLETHEGLRAKKTASAGPAGCFDLFSDDGRPAGGERPAALLEPRPQDRDRRHTGVGYEIASVSWSLCRRWGNSCPMSSSSSLLSCRWLPRRLSKCRRSSWTRLRSAWGIICASRRWWNSWCMCRLSCLIRRSNSSLPSRSSTFQFRVETEEGGVEVFKVLSQDSIQVEVSTCGIPVKIWGWCPPLRGHIAPQCGGWSPCGFVLTRLLFLCFPARDPRRRGQRRRYASVVEQQVSHSAVVSHAERCPRPFSH